MDILEVKDDVVWVLVSPFNRDDLSQGRLKENIQLHIDNGTVSTKMLANQTLVFNTLFEGHSDEEYQTAVASLQSEPWFNSQNIIWLNNIVDNSQYQHISLPWRMTNHCGFLDLVQDQNLRFNLVFEQLDQLLIKISQQGGIGAVSQMLNERLDANWQRLQRLNSESRRDFAAAN